LTNDQQEHHRQRTFREQTRSPSLAEFRPNKTSTTIMAAKAKAAAAKRAAAAKKLPPASNTKAVPLAQHDPTRPPPLQLKDQAVFKQILVSPFATSFFVGSIIGLHLPCFVLLLASV
jgi:hypothetical protein